MKICVYQYSTEDTYCEKLLLFFFNLLLFLSLCIECVMAKFFTEIEKYLIEIFSKHIADVNLKIIRLC